MNVAGATNDPYRARRGAGGFEGISSATRWLYAVVVVLMSLGFWGGIGVMVFAGVTAHDGHPNDTMMGVGIVVLYCSILLIYVQVGVGAYWVYKVWQWLPQDQRWTRHWRSWITPGQAALMLLIPYFHYYWMFVINAGTCDAFDRLRVSWATKEAAPKTLSIVCGVIQLVFPLFSGILWLIYMTKVERMMREMSAVSAPRMAYAF
jgi:hypothetical protein